MDTGELRDATDLVKRLLCALMLSTLLAAALAGVRTARAADEIDDPVAGLNLPGAPGDLPISQQEALLNSLARAGVRAIRMVIPNAKAIDFAQRVHAHGIAIDWLIDLAYVPGKPPRPPSGDEDLWRRPGLSHADAKLFGRRFAKQLAELESRGIVFAAFELGDEFNWAGANADFPLPSTGRLLDANDLLNDPEGRTIATGYRQYLASLTVLKQLRDRSHLNARTPVISGGLADLSDADDILVDRHADAVSVDATLKFLRENGLDRLVDGYGLHAYPPAEDPGSALGPADRRAHIESNGIHECRPPDSREGKPCWITAWGFGTTDDPCRSYDAFRIDLVREIRGIFGELAGSGTLGGQFYNSRRTAPPGLRASGSDPYRCTRLTASEKLAITPL
jgi:hypothetical protein